MFLDPFLPTKNKIIIKKYRYVESTSKRQSKDDVSTVWHERIMASGGESLGIGPPAFNRKLNIKN